MVWYSHFLKNFPQIVVIHTVKGFGIVNKAEVHVFLELSCFFDDVMHRHHQTVNTKIRLILFFAAKDGEALHSQQKQDRELTVAQIMNSLFSNSDLN